MKVLFFVDWLIMVHVFAAVFEQSARSRWLALTVGVVVLFCAGGPQ